MQSTGLQSLCAIITLPYLAVQVMHMSLVEQLIKGIQSGLSEPSYGINTKKQA